MSTPSSRARRGQRLLLRALPTSEARFITEALREETVGGALLLAAAAVAVVWASSPWSEGYETLRGTVVGPSALHLDLDLQTWAADGLLAIGPGEIVVSPAGKLLIRNICMVFDQYLHVPSASRYSKVI